MSYIVVFEETAAEGYVGTRVYRTYNSKEQFEELRQQAETNGTTEKVVAEGVSKSEALALIEEVPMSVHVSGVISLMGTHPEHALLLLANDLFAAEQRGRTDELLREIFTRRN